MGNVFPSNKNVHEIYDLKGSTFGRMTTDEELVKNPTAVMKDLNWIKRRMKLELGPEKRHLFLSQLEKDIEASTHTHAHTRGGRLTGCLF
jgi:1-phosphatidylinositol-4-phosphate 5-kinase